MKTSSKHIALALAVLQYFTFPVLGAQNKAPVAQADSFTANQNAPLFVPAPGVLANDTDSDGNALSAVLVGNVSSGTLGLNPDGSFGYTPAPNFLGTATFTYAASDGQALSGIATVTITVVVPVNHPPVLREPTEPFIIAANDTFTVAFPVSDPEHDSVTLRIVQFPSHGTATISGPITYTPALNYLGPDSFAIVANDGQFDSNIVTVKLIVVPAILISDVTLVEGNSGGRVATFTVTLSPTHAAASVNWRTLDGAAVAPSDYVASSGTVIFARGSVQETIQVPIVSDKLFELTEQFFVRLSEPVNAAIPRLSRDAVCNILNDDIFFGITEGLPPDVTVKVGERFIYNLRWTHPERWHLLDTIDVRITDDEGDVLYVRFDESSNTYSLFHPASERFTRPRLPGSKALFESSAATMYLQNSSIEGSGPTGPSVTLHLALSFKPKAAGRVFRVEAFAVDDFGNEQGFDLAGTITVLPR